MSLALIQESAKEVRRLAIAGSPLAVGDFRVKKLIGPLEQAGAKVPVFAQVAKAMSDLVNGTEAESASRLLTLSTLLNAILYTQGETRAAGNLTELETFSTNCSSTRMTARRLKPLIAALTGAGAGRLEVVKSACDQGSFNDLRLMDPVIQALGDTYSELSDLVAEKILPGYGPGIVPRLKAGFDLKGKRHDARKLSVMDRIDSAGTLELCRTALEEGSPEVKAAAITCLGQHEDCLPLVLEQAKSKNKTLRAAALEALARHDRPEIARLFTDLVKGLALDILAGPFRLIRNRQVVNSLLEEGRRVFALLLKGDEEQIPRFVQILDCLKGRTDTDTEAFALACFHQCEKLPKFKPQQKSPFAVYITGGDLADRLAWVLCEIGSETSLNTVVAKRDVLPVSAFTQVLQSALRIWSPEKIFQEFAGLLAQTKGQGREKSEVLEHTIRATCKAYLSDPDDVDAVFETRQEVQWDPRWLDAAIKADKPTIVCCLATRPHKGAVAYLSGLLETKAKTAASAGTRVMGHSGLIIRTLARCQHPKVTDVFIKTVASRCKGARHIDYDLQLLLQSARYLPAVDLPKLDAFAAELDEKFVDQYLEALAPLRSTSPSPQS